MMLAHEFEEFSKIRRTGLPLEMRQNVGSNFVSISHRDLASLVLRQTAWRKTLIFDAIQLMAAK
jgi:hypothetical protein